MEKGDYVLATKYYDGDPLDHWCVGFYDREENGRHYIVDNDGKQFRGNGFRRAARISHERGFFILRNTEEIEMSCRSLWWWKRCKIS
jgi:hypothetical protein